MQTAQVTHEMVYTIINDDVDFAVENPLPVGCTLIYMEDNKTICIVDGDGCPVLRTSQFCAVLAYMRNWLIQIVKIEYRISATWIAKESSTSRDMLKSLR